MTQTPSPLGTARTGAGAQDLPAMALSMEKLAVATNRGGELIFFVLGETGLGIWLPGTQRGQWTQNFLTVAWRPDLQVTDFDMISNCGQGRNDDTIDLLLLVAPQGNANNSLAFYLPALPFSTDLNVWAAFFANAMSLAAQMPVVSQARLGLLTKATRSVFLMKHSSTVGMAAMRCDFSEAGRVVGTYPITLVNPAIGLASQLKIAACVATRYPSYFEEEDAMVIAGASLDEAPSAGDAPKSGVEVHIPKTPAGDAWARQLNSPVATEPTWPTLGLISSVIAPDPNDSCAVINPFSGMDDPLSQKNWVISKDALFLGKPMPALPSPPGAGPTWRGAPQAVWTPPEGQKPGRWHWFQVFCVGPDDFTPSLCESQSVLLLDPGAFTEWVIGADLFHAVARPNQAHGSTALTVLCCDVNSNLYLGTKDPVTGLWDYITIA